MKTKYLIQTIEEHLNKTHDGTSMGKIKDNLNRFAKKYNQLDYEIAEIYDSNGKLLKRISQKESAQVDLNEIIKEAKEKGWTGLHIEHNHPILEYENVIPSPLSIPDMDKLRITNDDGEYIFQSITCESKNGFRMTLLRNDKFNIHNEGTFQNVTDYLEEDYEAYLTKYKQHFQGWVDDNIKDYVKRGASQEKFEKDGETYTLKEIGSFKDYIFKEMDYNRLFGECNCILRISKNDL